MKDLFSTGSDLYAKYRPVYSKELYEFILSYARRRETAWDCATGNGQVARSLVAHFRQVYATDLSRNQLKHAVRSDRIDYSICSAERSPFRDNSFDLITVAQAFHWLNASAFCLEATRVAHPDAVVAVWGYELTTVAPEIDPILHRWNHETLAPFWEPERRHVLAHYESLAFSFRETVARDFRIAVEWDCDELIGHLQTWSALKNMKSKVGDSQFRSVIEEIRRAWNGSGKKQCIFPVFLKLGRVIK